MSRFSRCTIAGYVPKPLSARTMVRVLACFTALLCFGLAHLYLRFSLSQQRVETTRLQALRQTLGSEINALRGRNEALKRPDRLLEYARLELGMVPYHAARRQVFRMPEATYKRYELARVNQGRRLPSDFSSQSPAGAVWLDRISERFGLISQAIAGEDRER